MVRTFQCLVVFKILFSNIAMLHFLLYMRRYFACHHCRIPAASPGLLHAYFGDLVGLYKGGLLHRHRNCTDYVFDLQRKRNRCREKPGKIKNDETPVRLGKMLEENKDWANFNQS